MRRALSLTLVLSFATAAGATASERASLRGSRAAMEAQNRVAREHGLTFIRTPDQIAPAVESGQLVSLTGNDDYEVGAFVSQPYAVPAVRTFVEQLAAGYRAACGQKLVVTSAVRAATKQPKNAHALSVHPAGMAVDLRVSDRASCRAYLEKTLLELESEGVLNGIREMNPPHYHVAIYPEPYLALLEARGSAPAGASADALEEPDWRIGPDETPARLVSEPQPSRSRGRKLAPLSAVGVLGLVGGSLALRRRVPLLAASLPRFRRGRADGEA